jgi:dienelactone hydrolase
MTKDFSLSQFKTTWEYYLTTYGSFQTIQSIHNATIEGYEVVYANCTFEDGYLLVFRLVFNNQSGIIGFWLDSTGTTEGYNPPDYVDEQSFTELNIKLGSNTWKLSGTLTLPKNATNAPAVILVHGSGPNDRDETVGPNKPFKDLAWGLASQGIIVLRYDKRTYVYPEEIASDTEFTPKEEVVDDAIAAVTFLQSYTNVNTSQIYVLGHSLGGMLAPQIAHRSSHVAGLVLLAAPARPLEDLILNQTIYLANLDGTIDANDSTNIQYIEEQVQKIKTLNFTDDEKVLNAYKAYWEYLSNYNQVDVAENLTIPLLFLQGKRDYQVTYEDDFLRWENRLDTKENAEFISYESLNHLFIPGEGTPTNTEYFKIGHVDASVITDIANWIKQQ